MPKGLQELSPYLNAIAHDFMIMTTSAFLTTTPNQRNFVQQLKFIRPDLTIFQCDGFAPADYLDLAHKLETTCKEVWVPYYGSVDGAHCVNELRKIRPDAKLGKFYESLISYFVHPWFHDMYKADTALQQQYAKDDTADIFIGISEIDQRFRRPSHAMALPFETVYPEQPPFDQLALAKGIFIGQPLVEDGSLDQSSYTKVVRGLIKAGLIDTYIQHPRETLSHNFPTQKVRLSYPLECYRSSISITPIYAIFSTASAYFSLFHTNVRIVEVDSEKLTVSPWARAVYAWLKLHNPTLAL